MWKIYFSKFLLAILNNLQLELSDMLQNAPEKLKNNPRAILFTRIMDAIQEAKEDPTLPKYWLGKSLGKGNGNWRRIKYGLPKRYRLFFKFFSQFYDIFFVWINDEKTLRKAGAKTDCYAVFERMLKGKKIPADHDGLLLNSDPVKEK